MNQPLRWPKFMTVLEIKHWRDNECIWEETKIPNMMHLEGTEYFLSVLFRTISGLTIPASYYLGLDNRSTILETDSLSSLQQEPTTYGYARQAVSSTNGFTIEKVSGVWKAISSIISFNATGGSWGPVKNLFLTNKIDSTGKLISTAALSTTRTVSDGDTLTMRMAISLKED